MTDSTPATPNPDELIRDRIFECTLRIHAGVMERLRLIGGHLEARDQQAAIDGLRRLERKINGMRSYLFLFERADADSTLKITEEKS